MNKVWSLSRDDFIEIMEEEAIILGKQRGKKTGDSLEVEFLEIAKKKNKMPKYLGATELNSNELVKQYEMKGLSILDLTNKEKKDE